VATSATAPEGKTDFVKSVLVNDPRANTKAVNDAWKAAGRDGQISATLVNKLRSSLGFAGNLRARTKNQATPTVTAKGVYTGKKRGRKPKHTPVGMGAPNGPHLNGVKSIETRNVPSSRMTVRVHHDALADLEADFDRLLFKVMGMGGLPAIEESLRQTRRLLYGGFSGGRG
jgi:hypothetical protein